MIVLGISSLYPIDLTAAAYALIFEPQPCRVFVNDGAALPSDGSTRAHSARAALPLPSWEWDADRTWYQCHLPLEDKLPSSLTESLVVSAKHIADLFEAGGASAAAARCIANIHELKSQLAPDMHEKQFDSWSSFIGALACALLQSVTGIKPHTEPWSPIREGSHDRYPVNGMLYRILSPMRAGEVRRFRRGGFVELMLGTGNWTRCHAFRCRTPGSYDCITHQSAQPELELRMLADDSLPARCGGALELELLAGLGSLVHLPWYAGAAFERSPENLRRICGWEYISPVTCVDKRRVARRFGGDGLRLTPGGYSLLDYEEEEVLVFCQGLLNLPLLDWDDLADWRDLANAYPRTDERLSKSQASARAFVNIREREYHIRNQSAGKRYLPKWEGALLFPKIGDILVGLLTIVGELRNWFNPFIRFERTRLNFPWPELLDNNHLEISRLTLPLTQVYQSCCDGLVKYGLPRSELSDITTVFQRGIHETRSRTWPTVHSMVASGTGWERENGLGLLVQSLRDAAVAYYSFAGFIVGAPLKATLYWLFLLLGSRGTRAAIRRLLDLRERPRLTFDLEVMDYGNGHDT